MLAAGLCSPAHMYGAQANPTHLSFTEARNKQYVGCSIAIGNLPPLSEARNLRFYERHAPDKWKG